MATTTAYTSYINFQNGSEYHWDMASSVSSARVDTMYTLFAKDCFNIPAGSTINKVVVKFYGKQSRSNTNLYAMRWGIRNIRYLSGWNGVYDGLNNLESKISSGEVKRNTLHTSNARQHETEKMDNSYNSDPYVFTLSDYCSFTRDQLMGGLWLEIDKIYQGTLDATIYIKDLKVEVTYTPPPQYYLDINGWINGQDHGDIAPCGTADVYINGVRVADDCTDYYIQHYAGTTYEIKDIKANPGWKYDGVHSGSLSGTINEKTRVVLAFSTDKIYKGGTNTRAYIGVSEANKVYAGANKIYG